MVKSLFIASAIFAAVGLKAQNITLAMADTPRHSPSLEKISSLAVHASTAVIVPTIPKVGGNFFGKDEMLIVASLRLERQVASHNPLLLIHKNLASLQPNAWFSVNAAFGHPAESKLAMREEILDRNEPSVAYIKASFSF